MHPNYLEICLQRFSIISRKQASYIIQGYTLLLRNDGDSFIIHPRKTALMD
jgi:hypothetical protein